MRRYEPPWITFLELVYCHKWEGVFLNFQSLAITGVYSSRRIRNDMGKTFTTTTDSTKKFIQNLCIDQNRFSMGINFQRMN